MINCEHKFKYDSIYEMRLNMKYYLIGIKGAGMSSLATILYDLGYEVIGYDDDKKEKYTEVPLKEREINIYYDNSYPLTDQTIIYSPAFKLNHPELVRAREAGLKCIKYNEMLGKLTKDYKTIAVCGCHGKTTTTCLLSHVFNNIIGTNYLIGDGTGYASKNNDYFIIEACEYKRHFLDYFPQYIIMTNIEFDHMDYYKNLDDVKNAYIEFTNNVKKQIIACGDDKNIRSINIKKPVIYYGFNDNNDIIAKNVNINKNGSYFDVYIKGEKIGNFFIPLVGEHIILNTLGVIGVSYLEKLDIKKVSENIKTFKGAKKRFKEKVIDDIVTVDDYAHHPTEIEVTIRTARQKYPDKNVIAILRPNTYSRTKALYKDFANALNKADKAYVMDIICDREKPEEWEGISSDLIINLLDNGEHISLETVDKLLQHKNSVILFMSCKDIYLLQEKYEKILQEKINKIKIKKIKTK